MTSPFFIAAFDILLLIAFSTGGELRADAPSAGTPRPAVQTTPSGPKTEPMLLPTAPAPAPTPASASAPFAAEPPSVATVATPGPVAATTAPQLLPPPTTVTGGIVPAPAPTTAATPTASEVEAKPTPLPEPPALAGTEVAIILEQNRFFPSRVRLRENQLTTLIFTNVNKRPAALVFERMNVEKWVAATSGPGETRPQNALEIDRELSTERITEIPIELASGSYSFHDALSGARGEIIVETAKVR